MVGRERKLCGKTGHGCLSPSPFSQFLFVGGLIRMGRRRKRGGGYRLLVNFGVDFFKAAADWTEETGFFF